MLTIAAIIVVLIAVNALYVAAEFAAVSVSTSRIEAVAQERGGLASRLLPYLRDAHALDRYIAACQIGITVSSLVLGAYGQASLARELVPVFVGLGGLQEVAAQSTAAIVVLIGLTVIQMVLGELIPKSLALQYPTRVALWTVIPMQWSLRVMSWFIVVLNGSGAAVLRIFGFQASSHRHIHSPEEIEYLLAESSAGGLLQPHEHRRLRHALRLGALRVNQFLIPRVRIVAIDIDEPAAAVTKAVRESPFTRLPVYQGTIDDIIGFIHAKDFALQATDGQHAIDVRTLIRPIIAVPESMLADQLLVRMREERRQLAIVLDEYGGTAGLVTIEDVLEQVVGDIVDEFKGRPSAPQRLPDGRVRLRGDTHLEEIEALLGTVWERGDTHTIGGRVIEALGRIPHPGEHVRIEDVTLEVESVAHRAVTSVLATVPDRRLRDRAENGA